MQFSLQGCDSDGRTVAGNGSIHKKLELDTERWRVGRERRKREKWRDVRRERKDLRWVHGNERLCCNCSPRPRFVWWRLLACSPLFRETPDWIFTLHTFGVGDQTCESLLEIAPMHPDTHAVTPSTSEGGMSVRRQLADICLCRVHSTRRDGEDGLQCRQIGLSLLLPNVGSCFS